MDVRGTAGLETRATFMPGCEPKDHERLFLFRGLGCGCCGGEDMCLAIADFDAGKMEVMDGDAGLGSAYALVLGEGDW